MEFLREEAVLANSSAFTLGDKLGAVSRLRRNLRAWGQAQRSADNNCAAVPQSSIYDNVVGGGLKTAIPRLSSL